MPVIIKIGGSQFRDKQLLTHLCEEATSFQGQLVLVAGGGAFADHVRAEQARLKFDDKTAHAMAILAMEQNGRILAGFIENAVPVSKIEEIARTLADGKIPIWMPLEECLSDSELEPTWRVTSDAISARLAERIGADGIILLKSCPIDPAWGLNEITEKEIIDPVFPQIVKRASLSFSIIGSNDDRSFDFIAANLQQCST